MEILNNRELAAIIWLLIVAVYFSRNSKEANFRGSLTSIFSAFIVWKIQIPILLMLIYIAAMVYGLYELGLWDFDQLKITLIWTFSVAFLSLFQTDKVKEDHNFLKHLVFDYLKFIAIIEFFIGLYIFPLIVELIILPISTLLIISSQVAGRDEKNQTAKKLIDRLLSSFGTVLLLLTLYMLISHFSEYINGEIIADLVTPPLLTLCYLPFIFFFMVYVTYESTNIRIEYHIKSKKQRIFASVLASVMFNARVKLLERWTSSLIHVNTTSYREIWKSISNILKHYKYERNPDVIDPKEGWCPYEIFDFLNLHGLAIENHHPPVEKWFTSSRFLEIGNGVLPNNIASYVEGEGRIAKKLTLKLNINEPDDTQLIREKFTDIVTSLYELAVSTPVPQWLLNAIETNSSIDQLVGFAHISVTIDYYNNPDVDGYSLKVVFLNKS